MLKPLHLPTVTSKDGLTWEEMKQFGFKFVDKMANVSRIELPKNWRYVPIEPNGRYHYLLDHNEVRRASFFLPQSVWDASVIHFYSKRFEIRKKEMQNLAHLEYYLFDLGKNVVAKEFEPGIICEAKNEHFSRAGLVYKEQFYSFRHCYSDKWFDMRCSVHEIPRFTPDGADVELRPYFFDRNIDLDEHIRKFFGKGKKFLNTYRWNNLFKLSEEVVRRDAENFIDKIPLENQWEYKYE